MIYDNVDEDVKENEEKTGNSYEDIDPEEYRKIKILYLILGNDPNTFSMEADMHFIPSKRKIATTLGNATQNYDIYIQQIYESLFVDTVGPDTGAIFHDEDRKTIITVENWFKKIIDQIKKDNKDKFILKRAELVYKHFTGFDDGTGHSNIGVYGTMIKNKWKEDTPYNETEKLEFKNIISEYIKKHQGEFYV